MASFLHLTDEELKRKKEIALQRMVCIRCGQQAIAMGRYAAQANQEYFRTGYCQKCQPK